MTHHESMCIARSVICIVSQTDFHTRLTLIEQNLSYPNMSPKSATKKQFNFRRYKQRYIALKILYFGWDYNGLASQSDSDNTIEGQLFKVLIKTCLIESPNSCNFNRCGRTDKGVSSYGQVVNLAVRSNLRDESNLQNIGLFTPEGYIENDQDSNASFLVERPELNYVDILNGNLPDHIKVIAWAPVGADFSARFNCQSRSYSYIFPKGDLCIELMQEALSHLTGQHDFRNICSYDLKNGVTNHVRTVLSAKIEALNDKSSIARNNHYKFHQVIIVGQAFLYHQIRCIMSVLFLVGNRKERPDIFKDLLDLNKCPSRPHYNPASPYPLCLFDCKYNETDLPVGWIHDEQSIVKLLKQVQRLWLQYKTKTLMIERVMYNLESQLGLEDGGEKSDYNGRMSLDLNKWRDFGLQSDNMSDAKYVELLKRSRDEPLEQKLAALSAKKAKLD